VTVIDLVDVATGSVVDTITFDGDRVGYDTGRASSLVESRRALIPDVGALVESLASWSNGYVLTRLKDKPEDGPIPERQPDGDDTTDPLEVPVDRAELDEE
jgi:hypothetical protein